EFMFILGVALVMAPLGIVVPDLSYFTSLLMLLLLFVSPIGFMTTILSAKLKLIVWANPIYYLMTPFRLAFMPGQPIKLNELLLAACISAAILLLGLVMFNKFKEFAAEYE